MSLRIAFKNFYPCAFGKSSLGLLKMLFSEDTDLLENQRTVQWKQIWNLCWKLQHQSFRIKRE